jgi:hypothetical protein
MPSGPPYSETFQIYSTAATTNMIAMSTSEMEAITEQFTVGYLNV